MKKFTAKYKKLSNGWRQHLRDAFKDVKNITPAKCAKSIRRHWFLLCSIVLFALIAATLLVYGYYFMKIPSAELLAGKSYTWDYYAILRHAMLGGVGAVADVGTYDMTGYAATYPNNIPIYILLRFIVETFGVSAIFIINGLLLLGSAAMLFVVTRHYSHISAIAVLVIFEILIAQTGYSGQLYTDTAGLFCVASAIFFFYEFLRRKGALKILFVGAIGVMIAVGCLCKPTIILFAGAFIVAMLFVKYKAIHKGFYIAVMALAVIGTMQLVNTVIDSHNIFDGKTIAQIRETGFPSTHWINLGTKGNYQYDHKNVQQTRKLITECGKKCASDENLRQVVNNITDRSLLGNLSFFSDKMSNLFIDPYFKWDKEGEKTGCSAPENPRCTVAYQVQGVSATQSRERLILAQNAFGSKYIIWGLVLLASVITVWRRWKDPLVVFVTAGLLAFLGYQLLGESHSRYLISFLPAFFILAALYFSKRKISYEYKK